MLILIPFLIIFSSVSSLGLLRPSHRVKTLQAGFILLGQVKAFELELRAIGDSTAVDHSCLTPLCVSRQLSARAFLLLSANSLTRNAVPSVSNWNAEPPREIQQQLEDSRCETQ